MAVTVTKGVEELLRLLTHVFVICSITDSVSAVFFAYNFVAGIVWFHTVTEASHCNWSLWKLLNVGFFCPGRHSTKFHTGRLRPEVQSLTLLYAIFDRKCTPFVHRKIPLISPPPPRLPAYKPSRI